MASSCERPQRRAEAVTDGDHSPLRVLVAVFHCGSSGGGGTNLIERMEFRPRRSTRSTDQIHPLPSPLSLTPMALTRKQEAFVNEYLIDFNATQAAIRAGYSKRTAGVIGHENLKKPNIAEEIQRRVDEKAMSANEALLRLADIARGNIGEFMEFQGGEWPKLNLAQAKDRLHLVKQFKFDSNGLPVIEMYSSYDALVQIGRVHGLFTDKSETDVYIKDGIIPVQFVDYRAGLEGDDPAEAEG